MTDEKAAKKERKSARAAKSDKAAKKEKKEKREKKREKKAAGTPTAVWCLTELEVSGEGLGAVDAGRRPPRVQATPLSQSPTEETRPSSTSIGRRRRAVTATEEWEQNQREERGKTQRASPTQDMGGWGSPLTSPIDEEVEAIDASQQSMGERSLDM